MSNRHEALRSRPSATQPLGVTLTFALCAFCAAAAASTYEVGPGKPIEALSDVPWESLQPGDTVLVNWRRDPYKEKITIGVAGAKDAPIVIRGVPGPGGELPVIDGKDAVSRPGLSCPNEERSVVRFIKLPGVNKMPRHIVFEALEVRNGRKPQTFTDSTGAKLAYKEDSGLIWFTNGESIVIRNCTFRDGGMGVVSCDLTRDFVIEGCYFVDNGMEGPEGAYVHQCYMETLGMITQYNRFFHLRKDCTGSNLKDRSAHNVIRYNWIEGGSKQIDMPDMYDTDIARIEAARAGDASLVNDFIDFDYMDRVSFVYGNVLIEPEGDGQQEMITYGGDMGEPRYYRKGMLHFYNNTCISKRSDATTIFKLKTNDESCDARNNIFYTTAPGSTLAISLCYGTVYLSHNWITSGWVDSHEGKDYFGEVNDDKSNIAGENPGFVDEAAQDYHLAKGSPCIDAGRNLNPRALPDNDVRFEYVKHQKLAPRPSDGKLDIGAYEYAGPEK
jgi:hypothetical protein